MSERMSHDPSTATSWDEHLPADSIRRPPCFAAAHSSSPTVERPVLSSDEMYACARGEAARVQAAFPTIAVRESCDSGADRSRHSIPKIDLRKPSV